MNEIEVKLDTKTVTVKKLPIGRYAQLLGVFKNLPQVIQGFGNFDSITIISKLPELLEAGAPDLINAVSIATDLKKEEVEELGAEEFTRLFIAVIEANKYKEVYDNLKKALARPTKIEKKI